MRRSLFFYGAPSLQINATARCVCNHNQRVTDASGQTETPCRWRGACLAPPHCQTPGLIGRGCKPVAACDILSVPSRTLEHRITPPPARQQVPGFLQVRELAHQIPLPNAGIGYTHLEQPHGNPFPACEKCWNRVELDNAVINTAIAQVANTSSFPANHSSVKPIGLSPNRRKPD